MNKFFAIHLIIATSMVFSSCGITEHDHDHNNDHDYATTVIVTLINQNNTTDTVKAMWKDLDGPGGALPSVIDTISLQSNTLYKGIIELYNESKSPKTNITLEILNDSFEHQFFYTPSSVLASLIEWSITDKDKNNLPIGLQFDVKTKIGDNQNGKINIVLSHYDSITKDGIRKSLESDIDIDYPVVIRI